MIFPDLSCPEFHQFDLQELGNISSQSLFTSPRRLFEIAYSKLTSEAPKKRPKAENTYRQFVKELSGRIRVPHFLKYASNEWIKLAPEQRSYYKEKATISCGTNRRKSEEIRKPATKSKRLRRSCSAITFYISRHYKKANKPDFLELSLKWKSMSEEEKGPFKILESLDKERYDFETQAASRFELILRLLRASEPKKFPKNKKRVYDIFKEHYIESLKESGWCHLTNIESVARYNYKKLSDDDRKNFMELKKLKKREEVSELFSQVLARSHINFKGLPLDLDSRQMQNDSNLFGEEEFEDDYEDFFANTGEF